MSVIDSFLNNVGYIGSRSRCFVKKPLFEFRHAHVFFAKGKKDKTFELITEKKFTNNAKYFVGRM